MLFSKPRLFDHHYEIPDLMKYLYKYKEDGKSAQVYIFQLKSKSSSWNVWL